VNALPENGPQNLQGPVYRRIAYTFRKTRIRNTVYERAADIVQLFTAKETIKPAQVRLVGLNRRLVTRVLQPPHHRFIPGPATPFTQPVDAPRFRFQLVVELLREVLIGSSRRLAYSLPALGNEVDPPDTATPA
jgi:hypothetical protein